MSGFHLKTALKEQPLRRLYALYELWVGSMPPNRDEDVINHLMIQMQHPFTASQIVSEVVGNMRLILDDLLASKESLSVDFLRERYGGESVSENLDSLFDLGLVCKQGNQWFVPAELKQSLKGAPLTDVSQSSLLGLYGWLNHHLATRMPREMLAKVVDSTHSVLKSKESIRERINTLPEEVNAFLVRLSNDYGGVVGVRDVENDFPGVDINYFREILEQSSLASVVDIDWHQFGIRHEGLTFVVFHEVLSLILLEKDNDSSSIAKEGALEGEFLSNMSLFFEMIESGKVRFTNKGTVYKSTGKRLAESLLLSHDREWCQFDILEEAFDFAVKKEFLTEAGEGSFVLTKKASFFLKSSSLEKQQAVLRWAIGNKKTPGQLVHQIPIRRYVLCFIQSMIPGHWYDAADLAILARHYYLAMVTSGEVFPLNQSSFPDRGAPNFQELTWDALAWIRKYLHLGGVCDLGYDGNDHLIAIRLSALGARLFNMSLPDGFDSVGHIVVNPDFEVVLFPMPNSHCLTSSLDVIAERERKDNLYHYRLSQESVRRSLKSGWTAKKILAFLENNSSTPLPQNVTYSLQDWIKCDVERVS